MWRLRGRKRRRKEIMKYYPEDEKFSVPFCQCDGCLREHDGCPYGERKPLPITLYKEKCLERRIPKCPELAGIMGAVIGDAMGVPYEFMRRGTFRCTGMASGGTHGMPAGTWSDDSALMLATADGLAHDMDIESIGRLFVMWLHDGEYTPDGKVFDVGNTTREAIERIANGTSAYESGNGGKMDNGNGSLMRILPLAFAFRNSKNRPEAVRMASSITHSNILSVMCCQIYVEIATDLLKGMTPEEAYDDVCARFSGQASREEHLARKELGRFLSGGMKTAPEDEIRSSGYVADTLEASVWCLLHSGSFAEAILKAVNLGGDTDTTGCVTGGLAGIWYGFDAIPRPWLVQVREREMAESIASRLFLRFGEEG